MVEKCRGPLLAPGLTVIRAMWYKRGCVRVNPCAMNWKRRALCYEAKGEVT